MRVIQVSELGGPDRLELVDATEPVVRPGTVLVEVEAAGVNYADVMMRRGLYTGGPPPPFVPGLEVAGKAVALGDGVDKVSVGQDVIALVASGGYAERVVAPASAVMPRPAGMSAEAGAAFPVNFYTADFALHFAGAIEAGRTVLVHAAAGGVGTAAVQLAKQAGARVIATASSEEKLEVARGLGADEALLYEGFEEQVRADVVLDSVGGDVFAQSFATLNPLGVVVAAGFAGGWWEPLDPAPLVGRNVGVLGFYLGRLMRHRPELVADAVAEIVALWEAGSVRPLVGATFPLAQAGEAHRLIEERRSVGKVVLVP